VAQLAYVFIPLKEMTTIQQEELFQNLAIAPSRSFHPDRCRKPRAIECDSFPFEDLSALAEAESWRKEINRPPYHIHKWWAQRLGSVFRGIVLATHLTEGESVMDAFYSRVQLLDTVVFDPFMGSGTTIGEALKCGARAIGRDINPVSFFLVRNALRRHSREAIIREFHEIERDVAENIQHYYRAHGKTGAAATTLYYFWVKQVDCPSCSEKVDLFSSYVFARHAYARKHPRAQAVCACCNNINEVRYDAETAICAACKTTYSPQHGPARGTKACCPNCAEIFAILDQVRKQKEPPAHKLYAKLVLEENGSKVYLPATDFDHAVYAEAQSELKKARNAFPIVRIAAGYNTNQALNYNYKHWHQMFNDRQLLCLHVLGQRIRKIKDEAVRELFVCLFSGALEFNNMFASYKGEGTGAVRHMFSHHILKPERLPLEANLWGTPKSSGAFSTLFKSRILRALDYCDNPFELRIINKNGRKSAVKVFGLCGPIGQDIAPDYCSFENGARLYLSCGDSSFTDVTAKSVDSVITDPPFFDNVHYSELADFFHVWQRHILDKSLWTEQETTRTDGEVQHTDLATFSERLTNVWRECHRVLKDDGLLVFTYHHSRPEGWCSILEALTRAGFVIVTTHPVKAEMSVATPKRQAKEPIDLDIIVVCRKRLSNSKTPRSLKPIASGIADARAQVARLLRANRSLSRNDIRVVVTAQVLRHLSSLPSAAKALALLDNGKSEIEAAIDDIGGNGL